MISVETITENVDYLVTRLQSNSLINATIGVFRMSRGKWRFYPNSSGSIPSIDLHAIAKELDLLNNVKVVNITNVQRGLIKEEDDLTMILKKENRLLKLENIIQKEKIMEYEL